MDNSVEIKDWCQCEHWQAGDWMMLKNYEDMKFCAFCGSKLEKEKLLDESESDSEKE